MDALIQNRPDVIILDKQLPGRNGLEICKVLKTTPHTRSIPVIMISALADVAEPALTAGADDFIEKPFNMHIILKKVSDLITKAGQLNKNDMIALTTLAASIGVPWQAPDRGLLPALIIAVIVVTIGRIISRWSSRNKKVEAVVQDTLSILVEDGVMQLPVMNKTKITRERLFAYLRSQEILHLGNVKRVYLEAGGFFTLIESTAPTPGLIVLPGWDTEFMEQQKFSDSVEVCTRCGNKRTDKEDHCDKCKNDKWVSAAL